MHVYMCLYLMCFCTDTFIIVTLLQVRLHLLDALRKYEEQKETNEDIAFIHHFLKVNNMTKLFQGNLTGRLLEGFKRMYKKIGYTGKQ